MKVELSNEEGALVLELLRRGLSDLREEIVHTEASHFHDALKARERSLEQIIQRFEGAATS